MQSWSTLAASLLVLIMLLPQGGLAQSAQSTDQSVRTQVAEQLVELGLQIHETTLDCSHFVNSLFETIGLEYDYQPSRVLYRGTDAFKRIYRPAIGDLIVWPGHVGIVVDPKEKTFVSALRTGVKIATYTSNYWKRRGRPRFLRYRLPVTPAMVWQSAGPTDRGIVNRSAGTD
jgi:cell wall-associated NlpC family hydrolase